MLIGLFFGIICWFIFKSILASLIVFYIVTGIRKSSLWLGIPLERRNVFLPPVIKPLTIGSFIKGVLIWPILIIHGDPLHDYFRSLDNQYTKNTKSQTFNKQIIVENKSLKNITGHIKECIGLTPDFSWEWSNYEPKVIIDSERIELENERVKYLIKCFNEGNWYNEYKISVIESDINNENDINKKKILRKKIEIEEAISRDIKLKYLIVVYKDYYDELLSNPKRFIKYTDDEHLIKIFYRCHVKMPGRLLDLGFFQFTEIEYNNYFDNNGNIKNISSLYNSEIIMKENPILKSKNENNENSIPKENLRIVNIKARNKFPPVNFDPIEIYTELITMGKNLTFEIIWEKFQNIQCFNDVDFYEKKEKVLGGGYTANISHYSDKDGHDYITHFSCLPDKSIDFLLFQLIMEYFRGFFYNKKLVTNYDEIKNYKEILKQMEPDRYKAFLYGPYPYYYEKENATYIQAFFTNVTKEVLFENICILQGKKYETKDYKLIKQSEILF